MMKRSWRLTISTGATLAVGAAGVLAGHVWAGGIPASKPLVYTGLLQSADGSPLSGSGHNIEIRLWNDASASGSANMLCGTNPQPLVTDATGRFALALGDECTKGIAANPDAYVEVLLDGAVLGGKRSKLGAVPYALEASHTVNADNATNAAHATTADTASAAGGELAAAVAALGKRIDVLESANIHSMDSVSLSRSDVASNGDTGAHWDACASNGYASSCGVVASRACVARGYRGGLWVGEDAASGGAAKWIYCFK